jgi:hypothetical protein
MSALGAASRWSSLDIEENEGSGYDRVPTHWLHVLAVKSSEA